MSRPRAYVDSDRLDAPTVTLEGDDFHHVHRVLRLGVGDALILFDGVGRTAAAEIAGVTDRDLELRVGEIARVEPLPGPPLVLLLAELKGDKTELVLQKATELGVDRFVPVTTTRGVPRPAAAARERRHQRRLKVAREACRQSGRAWLPEVEPLRPLAGALQAHGGDGSLLLWEAAAGVAGLSTALAETDGPTCVLVGPEGGFTVDEVDLARAHGFREVTLGRQILRAETAAIAAVTLACAQRGRLG